MSTHSTDGREWAKLSALKPGDKVTCDDGFVCGMNGKTLEVMADGGDPASLYVECAAGKHYLDGQTSEEDDDHLVGIWPVDA